jgi:hypothetical protein
LLRLPLAIGLSRHDNNRLDPVEAPQRCLGGTWFGAGPALHVNFDPDRE